MPTAFHSRCHEFRQQIIIISTVLHGTFIVVCAKLRRCKYVPWWWRFRLLYNRIRSFTPHKWYDFNLILNFLHARRAWSTNFNQGRETQFNEKRKKTNAGTPKCTYHTNVNRLLLLNETTKYTITTHHMISNEQWTLTDCHWTCVLCTYHYCSWTQFFFALLVNC